MPVVGGPDVATLARTFNEMLDRLENERRESARQALMVQEGERQRVARELHDEVGQTLTAMMLQIESLAAKIPDELRDELDELRETTRAGRRRTCAASRAAAARGARRPRPAERARRAGDAFAEHAGCASSGGSSAPSPLSEEQELVIYRVAQEALTNVARHATPRAPSCARPRATATVTLRVRDDGRGLPPRRADLVDTASAACASARC